MGIHSDAVGCVQLINIAAVCTKIVIDDTQQVMGRLVQIVPAAGELLDAAVQHRGDVQLFRQMRPARFQPEHLFILLLDGDQEHQDHRNADGQIDQRQAIVHDLDRDREQRQHRCRDLHPVDPASLLRPIIFCDPEVQTRHRTEQTALQQQHTVYDLATHPVSSFRVDPKIYPYCTLFSLRLQFGRRKRAPHPCTGRTPLPQNQIRTGSCGRLQTRRRWRSGTWPAGRRPADSSSPPRRHRR